MTYLNSTEIMQLHGYPLYMTDMVDACLRARLNLFFIGDTGSGKTQLVHEFMHYFGDKTMFLLGRNDMDTRELFQQINLGKLYTKPSYNIEPLVNPDTGDVEWYYPQISTGGGIIPTKLTSVQTRRVRTTLDNLLGTTADVKELTSRIKTQLFAVDELPNCMPAVRSQLFNLFDGFMEINGRAYPIGDDGQLVARRNNDFKILPAGTATATIGTLRAGGYEIRNAAYAVGIATGNLGQQFTESSNDLGRALKDRMHVTMDFDYFFPKASDTYEILSENTNPRVNFGIENPVKPLDIVTLHQTFLSRPVDTDKLFVACYLVHGLDSCNNGMSKRKMKDRWPNDVLPADDDTVDPAAPAAPKGKKGKKDHGKGSDEFLIFPLSMRAAKSVIRLSQALDMIVEEKAQKAGTTATIDYIDSMLHAYKFVAAYSGVLNEAAVDQKYGGDNYKALDAVIQSTQAQFQSQEQNILAGTDMIRNKKIDQRVLDLFKGRWEYMRDVFKHLTHLNAQQ